MAWFKEKAGAPRRVARGIGLGVIMPPHADPSPSGDYGAVPPVPAPTGGYWTRGSAPAGAAYMQTLWFRVNDMTFIACAKIGPKATSSDRQAIAAIIQSLR